MTRFLLGLLTLAVLLGEALACGLSPSLWQATRYYARAYGLEPELLAAVVWVESRYCPQAVSPAGARGLGQLMPATARGIGIPEHLLHDPQWNLWGSARYLRQQWEAFRNWELALAAYNAGPARVRQYRGVPPFPETRRYVRNVLYVYRFLKQGYTKSR
ncbi:Lytic transglycosylase catalytic (plasmid) [Allomeiothermus silvanus DSM 9946]|uniref:Lytic transglycosylase catalytic n=1 Tax=Allomeiothermus silvanus (strain ATCC 700542 / DSM 9946 / NBRC 106475 / NCIMB 13440 / VI-R2) TaxID=526227 RepID=D7BJK2_ALLS1|nr:lytic transglycosylase domain-containing protein [Allomeiothermus silvanus]ADH65358.1 Lytic transglycosylase catalytic [Allomeiothermus silvanus DSM 9946]